MNDRIFGCRIIMEYAIKVELVSIFALSPNFCMLLGYGKKVVCLHPIFVMFWFIVVFLCIFCECIHMSTVFIG